MDLQHALTQISDIHAQLAKSQVFRGYRSLTTLATGLVAILAGVLQSLYIANPEKEIGRYAALWMTAAIFNLAIVAAEMIYRSRRAQSRVQIELTLLAIQQFMPALFAGGMITAIIVYYAPTLGGWALPGLWQLMFAMGVFASCKLLPRATFWIAGFYLLSSGFVLILGLRGLSPWLMAVPFGIGQSAVAAILYVRLERRTHG